MSAARARKRRFAALRPHGNDSAARAVVVSEDKGEENNGLGLIGSDFVPVNQRDIDAAQSLVEQHVEIRAAMELSSDMMCQGGILVEHPLFPQTDNHRSWTTKVWSDFARTLMKELWTYGFAVCVSNPTDDDRLALPTVLSIHQLAVYLRVDSMGRRAYKVTDRLATLGSAFAAGQIGAGLRGRDDVLLYELHPPGIDGRLQSEVLSLRYSAELLGRVRMAFIDTIARNSRPVHFLERLPFQYDPRAQHMALLPPGVGLAGEAENVPMDPATAEAVAHQVRMTRSLNEGTALSAAELAGISTWRPTPGVEAPSFCTLPAERRFVPHVPIQSPEQYGDLCNQFLTQIASVFRVPVLSMINSQATRSQVSSGSSEIFSHVIEAHQHQLKTFMVSIIRDMFVWCYVEHVGRHALDRARGGRAATKPVTREQGQRLLEHALEELVVDMPGIPPAHVQTELYTMGILTYEAYRNYLSCIYHIPLENMEPSAVMERYEMAMVAAGKADFPPERTPVKPAAK